MKNMKKMLSIILAVICLVAGLLLEESGDTAADRTAQQESQEYIESQEVLKDKEESADEETQMEDYVSYYFRNDQLLEQHYIKHGEEMGFESMEAYEAAASAVIANPDALTKTEAEDGDYIYYVEESNEFVVVSQDGYIRTYFNPSAGIDYYNRQ